MWRDKLLNKRQERRGRIAQCGGFASFRQVIQYVPFLLAQGHNGSQNAFDKQATVWTLRSITSPPDNAPAQSPFGGIIGRFNTFSIDKRPQSRLNLEDIQAGATGFAVFQKSADIQQTGDLFADGLHPGLKIDPGECSVADPMPEAKEALVTGQQQPSNDRRFAPALPQA